MGFELPPLPYPADALEPVIDRRTMEIHHDGHHATYVKALNQALADTPWAAEPVEAALLNLDQLPRETQTLVRRNGGGHFNHSFFWPLMNAPGRSSEPDAALSGAIREAFGSLEEMQDQFTQAALSRFGSGWVWLCLSPDESLIITSTANQDTPFMPVAHGGLGKGHRPLLALDVWEHAYYLQYQNRRAEYVKAWWEIVNWQVVEDYFSQKRFLNLQDAG